MDSETLMSLAEQKLDDLTHRYLFFKDNGNDDLASFIAEEGLELTLAVENNHDFFVLPRLEDYCSDSSDITIEESEE